MSNLLLAALYEQTMFYGSDTQDFGIYSWVFLTPVLAPRGCLFCWQSTADNKNSFLALPKGKIFLDLGTEWGVGTEFFSEI